MDSLWSGKFINNVSMHYLREKRMQQKKKSVLKKIGTLKYSSKHLCLEK